jgi:hypothetical protein
MQAIPAPSSCRCLLASVAMSDESRAGTDTDCTGVASTVPIAAALIAKATHWPLQENTQKIRTRKKYRYRATQPWNDAIRPQADEKLLTLSLSSHGGPTKNQREGAGAGRNRVGVVSRMRIGLSRVTHHSRATQPYNSSALPRAGRELLILSRSSNGGLTYNGAG